MLDRLETNSYDHRCFHGGQPTTPHTSTCCVVIASNFLVMGRSDPQGPVRAYVFSGGLTHTFKASDLQSSLAFS